MSDQSDEFYREVPAWIRDAMENGKVNKITGLKPCPFCGGDAETVSRSFDAFHVGYIVRCRKCGAKTDLVMVSGEYTARDKAKEMWNNRKGDKA